MTLHWLQRLFLPVQDIASRDSCILLPSSVLTMPLHACSVALRLYCFLFFPEASSLWEGVRCINRKDLLPNSWHFRETFEYIGLQLN